jgi:CRP/FNR family transcriptional regulator
MTILEPVPGRSIPCEACPFRTKPVFRDFLPPELEFISAFKSGELNAEAGTTLFLEDTDTPYLYTVLAGWAFRYKMLPDGRRQILNFALPGDFLGLQTSVFDKMGHSAEALTDMVLCIFSAREAVGVVQRPSEPELRCDLACRARGADAR